LIVQMQRRGCGGDCSITCPASTNDPAASPAAAAGVAGLLRLQVCVYSVLSDPGVTPAVLELNY